MKAKQFFRIGAFAALFAAGALSSNAQLSDILGKIKSTVENVTATSNFQATDLVGKWSYVSPAVSFKGDNTLANIGGAAGATAVEDKLAPYYQKAGINTTELTIKDDLTFTWKMSKATLTGTIEKSDSSNLVFNFSAFGKVKIGKMDCLATKSGNTLNLTFDVSKLLAIMQKISSISSNSSFKTLNSLLSNYKDMYMGVKLKK